MAKSWKSSGADKFTRKQQKNASGKGRRNDTWEDDEEYSVKHWERPVEASEPMSEPEVSEK